MAKEQNPQIQTLENPTSKEQSDKDNEQEEDDDEEEEAELRVKEMAELIRHYRTTLPNRISKALSSLLVAQRPVFHNNSSQLAEIGASGDRNPDGEGVNSGKGAFLIEEDKEIVEKIQLLKLQISRNIAAMPAVLKRMNDCISNIDKLDVYNGSIPPAFKRRRTS